jgi:hypothetical protein
MAMIAVLDNLSLFGVFLGTATLIVLLTEVGVWLSNRYRLKRPDASSPYTGTAVGATLGLLAFLLAFSFGSATSRYDARKQLVLDEANAIGTVQLRAAILDHQDQAQVICTLRDYVTDRLGYSSKIIAGGNVQDVLKNAVAMQAQLWRLAINATEHEPTPHTALFLSALNDMIDIHEERVTVALYFRMPEVYWLALYCLVAITALLSGYETGNSGHRRSFVVVISVATAFSIVLTLVAALDHPDKVSTVIQQPLLDVQASLDKTSVNCL